MNRHKRHISSTKVRNRARRSAADVVEPPRDASREPAAEFYARLAKDYGCDLDLEAVIRKNRRIH